MSRTELDGKEVLLDVSRGDLVTPPKIRRLVDPENLKRPWRVTNRTDHDIKVHSVDAVHRPVDKYAHPEDIAFAALDQRKES